MSESAFEFLVLDTERDRWVGIIDGALRYTADPREAFVFRGTEWIEHWPTPRYRLDVPSRHREVSEADERVEGAIPPPPVAIVYRNHRGVTGVLRVLPRVLRYGSSEWHPEPQWLLDALDVDKGQERTFALKDVLEWGV